MSAEGYGQGATGPRASQALRPGILSPNPNATDGATGATSARRGLWRRVGRAVVTWF